jgi:hypothetical protein
MYTVYKTVNLANGKFYIGVHKTNDPNDSYLGSGKHLRRAINKHGVENFKKEVLLETDVASVAYAKEAELVTKELVESASCYNLKLGGHGGFDFVNDNHLTSSKTLRMSYMTKEQRLRGRQSQIAKFKNDAVYRERYSEKRRQCATKQQEFSGAFENRTHSEETKKKIGLITSKAQSASGNSQCGTKWICHKVHGVKKIKSGDLKSWVNEGWIAGRKLGA